MKDIRGYKSVEMKSTTGVCIREGTRNLGAGDIWDGQNWKTAFWHKEEFLITATQITDEDEFVKEYNDFVYVYAD